MKDGQGESDGRSPGVRRRQGESVRRALQTHADEIVEAELEEAYDRLEASRSLSPETIEAVSRMATRVGDGVLAAPLAALEDASESDVRGTVADLFGLDGNRESENDWETRTEDVSIDS